MLRNAPIDGASSERKPSVKARDYDSPRGARPVGGWVCDRADRLSRVMYVTFADLKYDGKALLVG